MTEIIYKLLMELGWVDNGLKFANFSLLENGNRIIVFDKKADRIYHRFSLA